MNKIKIFRLRFWLPFSIFTTFTLLLIGVSILQYRDFRSNLERRTIVNIKEKLTRTGNRLQRLYNNNLDNLVNEEIDELNISNDVLSLALINEQGVILKGSKFEWHNQLIHKCIPNFNYSYFQSAKQRNRQEVQLSKNGDHIFVYEPFLLPTQSGEIRSLRIGLLFVEFDLSNIKSYQINRLIIRSSIIWGLGLFLLGILSLALYYGLTLPFQKMQSAIHLFGEGKYDARINFTGKGEFKQLGNAFNKMADEVSKKRNQLHALLEEQKQIEMELRESKKKAEESDRLKSAFLTNMSHEIRTPMNGILGFTELLKEADLTIEERQEYINIIEQSGNRMLHLLNDLIDISKIEAGLINIEVKPTNINEQNEHIYTFFKPAVTKKGMELIYQKYIPIEEATINTDQEKLFAILTNLVNNAIKYTDQGSVEFGYEKKGDYIEYFIKDTGIGIPLNRQTAIFGSFIQADISDVQARQGAGLGLSIAKAYVEKLGGKIWLESEPGKGSTFYFTIPYLVEPKEKISEKKEPISNNPEKQNKALKILVVEDDKMSEFFITTILKHMASQFLYATSGVEAVKISQSNPDIHLIMMDIKMPGMNGYDATRLIRQFNNDVIIIAQTAYAQTGDSEKAIEAGCNEYISKPINKEKLRSLINKYFN